MSTANTATRERGIDILAERDGGRLAIEVKGFPSSTYVDPRRAGESKPTQPASQARQWYSDALLKTLLTLQELPEATAAIGLPDAPTYRSLVERTTISLATLGVELFWVRADGTVLHEALRTKKATHD